MKTKIQIPTNLLPKIKIIKRKYNLSTKEAFLFLMGYNTPSQKKDSSTDTMLNSRGGYNTPHRIRKITIIEVEVA